MSRLPLHWRIGPAHALTHAQFTFGTYAPPPVVGVSHTAELMPGLLTMSWVMSDTAVTITLRCPRAVWVSVGFNDKPSMVGADAVVAEPVAGAVTQYGAGGWLLELSLTH